MTTTDVCFSETAVAAVNPEGHSAMEAINDDVIPQCRSISPNCNNSPIPRYERNMGFFRQLSRRFGLRSNDDLVFANSNEDDNQSSSTDSCSSHTPSTAAVPTSLASYSNKKASGYISCASSETSSTVDIEEQLQELQLQKIQQQQQHQHKEDNEAVNADNNDNANETLEAVYSKERKSFARSSFSRLQRRSTNSLRRAFEAFSHSSRSLSCSAATPPSIVNTPPSSTFTNNGTTTKACLKSSSNQELNKKSQISSLRKYSYCSASSTSSSCSSATSSKTKIKPPPQRILRQPVSYTYLKGISGLPTQRVPRNSVCCQYARR